MSNMSYCRFENTANDLRDCVLAMEDAEDMNDLDLSKYEMAAMMQMRDLCADFLEKYDELGGK